MDDASGETQSQRVNEGELDPLIVQLIRHFRELDPAISMILKGHLFLEEQLNTIVEGLVPHPECLNEARLTFAHKLAIARAASTYDCDSPAWNLLKRINELRNTIAHKLDTPVRRKKADLLRACILENCGLSLEDEDEGRLIQTAVAFCSGFLTTEMDRNRKGI